MGRSLLESGPSRNGRATALAADQRLLMQFIRQGNGRVTAGITGKLHFFTLRRDAALQSLCCGPLKLNTWWEAYPPLEGHTRLRRG